MPKRFFRRISDGYRHERERAWFLRPFRVLMEHPSFLAVTRRSVVGALWIGIFLALLPLPGQTLLAVVAALVLRVNVPITFAAVWLTNPLTMLPIYYFEYRLGLMILGQPAEPFNIDMSWQWLAQEFQNYWGPLLTGSVVTAAVIATSVYVAVSVTWRLVVTARFRRRRRSRNAAGA